MGSLGIINMTGPGFLGGLLQGAAAGKAQLPGLGTHTVDGIEIIRGFVPVQDCLISTCFRMPRNCQLRKARVKLAGSV